ncbi:AMP-binding protein [[Mycobacterium] kokjensenii]|uniref:AMP-binding protein n=1 Tax=[Mycobacterium] kokjensenii TaxID=3064287 RepID=A0ABM9LXJ8_9MYCO|nr:AMP-binding protein [Mycolicibacter sp. MU0083]CAJ1506428.1 AMP-binding protein [Mycolicibacter sp. MU0083]
MSEASLLSLLRERAMLAPEDPAYTYTDYDQDWNGVAETLSWAQTYRRVLNVARELQQHGAAGDRAVILAPQGLAYVAAFLGAMQAGFIAVPLPVPLPGAHDERVAAVLTDTAPSVVLTTASSAELVGEYVRQAGVAATVVEIDALDLDAATGSGSRPVDSGGVAYLQYTSGSTRLPAGVMVSHRNLAVNFRQFMAGYFPEFNGVAPADTTIVSWLPFYHDLGLILGIIAPVLGGYRCELTSPVAFLQRPARWIQAMAGHRRAFSAAPNFAFELAVRKTSDEDMAGLDLGDVLGIVSGSERVHPATLDRFLNRFAPYNFRARALHPAYGLAEATLYVATLDVECAPQTVYFESEKLTRGSAQRCEAPEGTPLLSYGVPKSPAVRIVDPETCTECAGGTVGEIWTAGENVAGGYWQRPEETRKVFAATLADPSPDTPAGPWLRTGDLGFISEGELFIVGRMKDLLIIYGRNHYPEDIEATLQEISGGRVAAISVPVDQIEQLVTIIEVRDRGESAEEAAQRLRSIRNDVQAAVSQVHGVTVSDVVLVPQGSIPITTSGKVRRAACVDQYQRQQFTRMDG